MRLPVADVLSLLLGTWNATPLSCYWAQREGQMVADVGKK